MGFERVSDIEWEMMLERQRTGRRRTAIKKMLDQGFGLGGKWVDTNVPGKWTPAGPIYHSLWDETIIVKLRSHAKN